MQLGINGKVAVEGKKNQQIRLTSIESTARQREPTRRKTDKATSASC